MAALRYMDEHNKVGYLLKPTGSDNYHQIIDFLRASHIRYALTHNPIIFDSLVKQFWSTATLRSPKLGPPAIQASIDETPYTITEDLVRSQLHLADDGGIDDLPIAKICSGMNNLGYVTEGKLTFFKNKFSPQWRFLVHTILHCLSTKSGSWDQFGSTLVVALICLSDGRQFNWSSYIFKGMVSNIRNAKKFLMYPRFLQTILAAMLSQDQKGEGAGVAAQPVPQHMPAPDQPQDYFSFTIVEDEPLRGSFHMSPARSTQAPPAETELKDHKKLFKDVVGKLVKKVKAIEVKLRTTKSKMVMSDSDQEEGGKQDVDLDALLALANAAVSLDSNIPPGGASNNPAASSSVPADVPTSANVPTGSTSVPADVPTSANVPTGSTSVPADVPTSVALAGVSNKGKTPMVEEDITVKERTFTQMKDDRLREQAAKRLHDEEQAQVDRQRAELQRRRQQEVLDSAMYYTEADWINIMAQVEANASLSRTLLGDDVSEENFPARMAALINRKKQALAKKLAKERKDRPMTQGQQRTYMRQFVKNQSGAVYSTRWIVSSPKSSGTRSKSLGRKRLTKSKSKLKELDLDADDQTFIKVISNEDFEDEAPLLWSALVGWEVITTPLGYINDLYRIDRSIAYFTTLREILYIVDRQDLVTLYGLVVKYYKNHPVAGAGLIFWRLYTLSNVHVLETVSGEVVYLFADVSYPFSVKLMERMLTHKLEIDKDVMGNDMTTATQLIQFIKNQLVAAQVSLA
nr:synaptobrevin, longin-like domain protein [Tanacetum cinerariifolium]